MNNKKNKDYINLIFKELANLDSEIDSGLYILNHPNYSNQSDSIQKEIQMDMDEKILLLVDILFRKIRFFLEINNLHNELLEFDKEYFLNRHDLKFLWKSNYDHESDTIYGEICPSIRRLLIPIKEYFSDDPPSPSEITDAVSLTNRKTLENILNSTGYILKLLNIQPTTEPQVYNGIKEHLKLVLPDIIDDKTFNFSQKLKTYIPDFSSVKCESVVEYKYIKSEEDLKKSIDDLCADSKAYKTNTEIKYIYVVFYMKKYIKSVGELEEYWKEKQFPNFWKSIYIYENLNT
ncbi:hypothetical protein LEP1GSC195_1414 [Leptospira wolbachii serovar Codice str. CDC]|uniref:Uncharacterized protein n=1 Tax=Leptospira wolbachii serovar Codice str. CDC TaxID=1218599 RepID=R9A756_9LEPT|nr:hypothetical protein [Leptospira wolbachii]EOQ97829.1 hypothetical protein LEP1GSC195_1414 [Leptospira wolbachii serovar Codice str. CDC]